ncbi:hypothetical protein TNCV_2917481 [Trichonephila clavipes]|nr:hypothetical protein TNCV_2917481 [Trichonephila clavipes]
MALCISSFKFLPRACPKSMRQEIVSTECVIHNQNRMTFLFARPADCTGAHHGPPQKAASSQTFPRANSAINTRS